MPEPTDDPMIPEDRRRVVFDALVSAQREDIPALESHGLICRRFGIDLHKLRDIESEGLANTWPPLG